MPTDCTEFGTYIEAVLKWLFIDYKKLHSKKPFCFCMYFILFLSQPMVLAKLLGVGCCCCCCSCIVVQFSFEDTVRCVNVSQFTLQLAELHWMQIWCIVICSIDTRPIASPLNASMHNAIVLSILAWWEDQVPFGQFIWRL